MRREGRKVLGLVSAAADARQLLGGGKNEGRKRKSFENHKKKKEIRSEGSIHRHMYIYIYIYILWGGMEGKAVPKSKGNQLQKRVEDGCRLRATITRVADAPNGPAG